MINFNSLPTERPNSMIPEGRYIAVVEAAEMKAAKDPQKPAYLSVRLGILDENNNRLGNVFDIFTESEASLQRYKLQRFLTALQLNLTSFELSDLTKIVVGKKLEADIKTEVQAGYSPRNVVDATTNEIYYQYVDLPFTASDSADTTSTPTGDTSEY